MSKKSTLRKIEEKTQRATEEFNKVSNQASSEVQQEVLQKKASLDVAIEDFNNGNIKIDELKDISQEYFRLVANFVRNCMPFSERFKNVKKINKVGLILTSVFAVFVAIIYVVIMIESLSYSNGVNFVGVIAAILIGLGMTLIVAALVLPLMYSLVIRRSDSFAYACVMGESLLDLTLGLLILSDPFTLVAFGLFMICKICILGIIMYFKDLKMSIDFIRGYFLLKKAVKLEASGEIDSYREEIELKARKLNV